MTLAITYVNQDGSRKMCDRHPDRPAVHTECWNLSANATASCVLPGQPIETRWSPVYGYCDECAPEVEVTMKVRKPLPK